MTMTKREFERQAHMFRALAMYGISEEEARALRRISMTLRRWHEMECGTDRGAIERDGPNGEGRPRYRSNYSLEKGIPLEKCPIVADRERGALKRLAAICKPHSRRVVPYVQGDPRGCALYLVPVKRLRDAQKGWAIRRPETPKSRVIDSIYSQGIAVY